MRLRRAKGERGAALIEAAIMMPVVVMLTFGAIEFGFAFNEQGTVRASTRAAARSITTSTGSKPPAPAFYGSALDSLDISLRNLVNGVPQYAMIYNESTPPTGDTCTVVQCQKFEWDTATNKFKTTAAAGGSPWQSVDRNYCQGQSSVVGIRVKVKHSWITGIPFVPGAGSDVMLSSDTVMALEPIAGSRCGLGFP